ncbi:hypothetical protein L6164_003182 [Bauhinia variegata]|uniref:Uncharacterized protein n=1 Tax=Bauhinia variegata TaxID=167791 RepID=A0ACB9Q0H8_BAUVA|nr:hypothetical protein L6164_003182 [Bauhinia variegata]
MSKHKAAANLPEEIIEEILLRLPVKSLSRFRCVSKSFNAMISSPKFGDEHYEIAVRNPYDLSRHQIFVMNSMFELNAEAFSESHFSLDKFELINPDFTLVSSGFKTCISSKGLICFSINYVFGRPDIYLWNPMNANYEELYGRYDIDPDCIYYPMGFGYDSSTDDHKIVIPFEPRGEEVGDLVRFQVYSLTTLNWTEIEGRNELGPFTFPYLRSGIYLKGEIYWLGFGRKKRMIMCFDVGDEEFYPIQPPVHECKQAKTMEMGVLGDCLSVCIGEEGNGVALWVMKDYYEERSWNKMAFIPFNIIPDSICCLMPIFVLENGEVLMFCPVNSGLSIFNLKENKCISILPTSEVPIVVTAHLGCLIPYL